MDYTCYRKIYDNYDDTTVLCYFVWYVIRMYSNCINEQFTVT